LGVAVELTQWLKKQTQPIDKANTVCFCLFIGYKTNIASFRCQSATQDCAEVSVAYEKLQG